MISDFERSGGSSYKASNNCKCTEKWRLNTTIDIEKVSRLDIERC
jgi:hypothetical protein